MSLVVVLVVVLALLVVVVAARNESVLLALWLTLDREPWVRRGVVTSVNGVIKCFLLSIYLTILSKLLM